MKLFGRKRYKIGLALGSGSARGLAHIGVIKALQEASIPVDMIAGTSIGAVVGACFAKEGNIEAIEKLALKTNLKQLALFINPDFRMLRKGIVQGGKIEELLLSVLGDVEFKDLKIPFASVAADINTGHEVISRDGPVREAVRASISIPAIFVPVVAENRCLVDGGLINPLPVDIVKEMGADFIIAVNVLSYPQRRKSFTIFHRSNEQDIPNIFDTLLRSIFIMEYEIIELKILKADITINPDVSHIGAFEFYKAEEAIKEGYRAAQEYMPEIEQLLGR